MKITKDIDIPIDGLAVTLATFILSPDDTRIRNALVVAALHWFLHPYEINHEISDNTHHALDKLGRFGGHRENVKTYKGIHGQHLILDRNDAHFHGVPFVQPRANSLHDWGHKQLP